MKVRAGVGFVPWELVAGAIPSPLCARAETNLRCAVIGLMTTG